MASRVADAETLARLRREIESIDRSILLLLAARLHAAQRAIRVRGGRTGSVTDREQERRVLLRGQRWAEELGVPPRLVENLFRSLLEEGKTRVQVGEELPESPVVTLLLASPAESARSSQRDPRLQLVPVPASP